MKILRMGMDIHFENLPDVEKCDFGSFATLKLEDVEKGDVTLFFQDKEQIEEFIRILSDTEWELPKNDVTK